MTEKEATIILNMLPGVGPRRFLGLKQYFGSAVAILAASVSQLEKVEGVGEQLAMIIVRGQKEVDLAAEIALIEESSVQVVLQEEEGYPPLLREIVDPPILLYLKGELLASDCQAGIGIVGTRRSSHYGLAVTKKLGYQLAYQGLSIYSGLARGVDTVAHQAALAAQGRTVAVIGCGLSHLYPRENVALAEKIALSGAIISEFPMGMPPRKEHFPKRNRIISGCSFGVLVVEAGIKSGSLITAHQAVEQGRALYAIPGRIDQEYSAGTNRLICEGAKLVTEATDILEDMPLLFAQQPQLNQPEPKRMLAQEERTIYQAIGEEPTSVEEIIEKSSLPPAQVSSKLVHLELSGHVKAVPGGRFIKLL